MDGSEKLSLLMIGKSANPSYFTNVKSKSVEYQANMKVWVTSEMFKNWLLKINKIFCKQNRKVMLLIDKLYSYNGKCEFCFSHPI